MGRKINGQIMGIVFKDVTYVNVPDQPACPLENTDLASECKNSYGDPSLRDDSPCEHLAECSAKLDR